MPRDFDANASFTSRQGGDGTESHDLPTQHLVPIPVLCDFRRLGDEENSSVRALKDKQGPSSRLVLCFADDASTDFDARKELTHVHRRMGVHQKFSIAREASPEGGGQLHPL